MSRTWSIGGGVAVLVATALAGGCAGFGRAEDHSTTGAARTPATSSAPAVVQGAQRTHEVPTPASPERVSHPAAGGAAAVTAFAQRFINWSPRTVSGVMNDLAQSSVGQARSAMALAAAQVAGTDGIAQNGISNSGTVESVAPLRGAAGRFVVVTRERTTATLTGAYDGLRPAWHVTVATVAELPGGGWVVSGWQPEN